MSATAEADPKFLAFLERLKSIDRTEVFIGVLSSGKAQMPHPEPVRQKEGESGAAHKKRAKAVASSSTSAVTQVDVATWMEFGAGDVEERSFLRDTINIKHAEITSRANKEIGKVAAGKQTAAVAYDRIGADVVGMVQKRIADGIAPGNDPATIAKKGSSTPLIDSGQLRSAITHEVKL